MTTVTYSPLGAPITPPLPKLPAPFLPPTYTSVPKDFPLPAPTHFKTPLRMTLPDQIATQGTPIPLSTWITTSKHNPSQIYGASLFKFLKTDYHHPDLNMANVKVTFWIKGENDRTWQAIDETVTDRWGHATAWFTPLKAGKYQLTTTLDGYSPDTTPTGTLSVKKNDDLKPMLALDIDGILKKTGTWEKALAYCQTLATELINYNLIAVTSHQDILDYAAYRIQLKATHIPLLFNDACRFSPYDADGVGHDEALYEYVKWQRYYGTPIVGVVAHLEDPRCFAESGILNIGLCKEADAIFARVQAQKTQLDQALERYKNRNPLDDLSLSKEVAGNQVTPYFTHQAATSGLLDMLNNAHSFIGISNFAWQTDGLTQKIKEILINKARDGVRVVLLIDELCRAMAPGDEGFDWFHDDDIKELRDAGVTLVFHETVHGYRPGSLLGGNVSRLHRKIALCDITDSTSGQTHLTAFTGGGVLGKIGMGSERMRAASIAMAEFLKIHHGPQRDYYFSAKGPIVDQLYQEFQNDFRRYAGKGAEKVEFPSFETSALYNETPSSLRYITQDPGNKDCQDLLLRFMRDPEATRITLTCSFVPSFEFIELLRIAAAEGKKITLIFGPIHMYDHAVTKRMTELAGIPNITLHLINGQLHAKVYIIDYKNSARSYALYGVLNQDGPSGIDKEAMYGAPLDSPAGKQVSRFMSEQLANSHSLNMSSPTTILENFKRYHLQAFSSVSPSQGAHRGLHFFSGLGHTAALVVTRVVFPLIHSAWTYHKPPDEDCMCSSESTPVEWQTTDNTD